MCAYVPTTEQADHISEIVVRNLWQCK